MAFSLILPQGKLLLLGNNKILVFMGYLNDTKACLYALELEYSEVNKYQKVVSHMTKIWSFYFPWLYHIYDSEISRL
jgi:hypothetical protein